MGPATCLPPADAVALRVLRYRIDARDVIVEVGAGFEEFAAQNGAPGLAGRVLGTPLWAHLHGEGVTHLYRDLVARCRATRGTAEFPFRCDSPTHRRFLRMRMTGLPDGSVAFESATLREEARTRVAMPSTASAPEEAMLVVCAWCRNVEMDAGEWVELEEAVRRREIFSRPVPPRISHGICPPCYRAVRAGAGL